MVESITGLDEARGVGLDGKLNFAKEKVVEADVDEDVVGAVFQPILDSHYPELLLQLLILVQAQHFSIDHEHLLLLGGELAAQEVAEFERYQIGRRRPIGFLYLACACRSQDFFVESFGAGQDAMDNLVQILDDFAVQVLHNLRGELATYALVLVHLVFPAQLFLYQQQTGFQLIVQLFYGANVQTYLLLLLSHPVVEHLSVIGSEVVGVVAFLHLNRFGSIAEMIPLELLPEFLKPLGQNSENCRMFESYLILSDLLFAIQRQIFRNFSPN